jgi:hypothetical protein
MSSPCPLPVITPPPLTGDETPNPEATAVPVGEEIAPVPGEVVTPFYPCMPDTATAPVEGGSLLPVLLLFAAACLVVRTWAARR